jgi:hypothetical protein
MTSSLEQSARIFFWPREIRLGKDLCAILYRNVGNGLQGNYHGLRLDTRGSNVDQGHPIIQTAEITFPTYSALIGLAMILTV